MGNFMRARAMSILFSKVYLGQRSTDYGLWSSLPALYIVLLEQRHAHSCMSTAAFSLQWQS